MTRPIPFRAALFDLDGTLLDSMYVWERVDEIFFADRGLEPPPDYSLAIAGMSYRETAEYTINRFGLRETCDQVIAEWTRLSRLEYALHVQLKPGSLAYLRMLKRSGVQLAVATALPPDLYEPCLERLGVLELFDCCCSTNDVGGRGKLSGEVYRLAAERLGTPAPECAVFEDVYAGIAGAKRAGMRAYCVRDDHSASDFGRIGEIADAMLDTLDDMRAIHDFPDSSRCVIFTAHCEGDPKKFYAPEPGDFVLCADGGWRLAAELGVAPDRVIGDFDSSDAPDAGSIERHPVEKDDTDTMLCIKSALAGGYDRLLLIGGFGGRLDHTLANLQSLHYAAKRGARAEMIDGERYATVILESSVLIPRREGKLSIFALDSCCTGVSIQGTKYTVENCDLTNAFPIGVSNEFSAPEAEISVEHGALLIVTNGDN